MRTIVMHAEGVHYLDEYRRTDHRLDTLVEKLPRLRRALLWHAVRKRRQEMSAEGGRLTEWWQINHDVLRLLRFTTKEFDSFIGEIRSLATRDDRLVALTVAFSLYRDAGRPRKSRERMWRTVKGEPELEAKLRALLHPPPRPQEVKYHRRVTRDWERRQAIRREQEETLRREWRAHLEARTEQIRNVEAATQDRCFVDLFRLARRIGEAGSRSRWGADRWEVLEEEFGQRVAEAARDGLIRNWRLYDPGLRSEVDGSQIMYGTIVGLTGLAIEAREDSEWAERLSEREAVLACRYATHEMNGLPDWAPRLFAAHPQAFDMVIGPELTWEFELPADTPEPHHMMSTLRYGPAPIRERYLPLVQRLLEQHEPAHARTLENALSLVLGRQDLDKAAFADLARRRYESSSDKGRSPTWLVAWMCVEANPALAGLRAWLEKTEDPADADRRMIAFCTALMDHGEMRFGSVHRDFESVPVLGQLVPLVYQHVRLEEDNVHEGAYTPDERDNAERARGYLVGRVAQTPGREAFDTLMDFSHQLPSPSKWSRNRMVVLAHRRAAEDAESPAWTTSDVVAFAEEAEKAPRSARDLFELARARLDDLKLDLEEGDQSEARILRRVDDEEELRNWLANRLRQAARGRYVVSSEDELADETRPDLRIHATAVDAPVGIELKVADKWSYAGLVERLRNQLVGQYLRDIRSSFGIFFLVRREKERWRDNNGRILSFGDLLDRLQEEADLILQSRQDLDAISVLGIDLTRRDVRPSRTRP